MAIAIAGGLLFAISTSRRPAATYQEARAVVDRRCVPCHSARPTNVAFPIAPRGVTLDTAAEMARHAQRIRVRAVVERTMPLANMSGMTDAERDVLGRWVEGGAPTP